MFISHLLCFYYLDVVCPSLNCLLFVVVVVNDEDGQTLGF